MAAAKIANLKVGNPTFGNQLNLADRALPGIQSPPAPISTERAAEMLNVSPAAVKQARVVHQHGVPGLVDQLDQGRIAASAAAGRDAEAPVFGGEPVFG